MGHFLAILGIVVFLFVTMADSTSEGWTRNGSSTCILFAVISALAYVSIAVVFSGPRRGHATMKHEH